MEVMEMNHIKEIGQLRIVGVKINQPSVGQYSLSFRHLGDFRLGDYEELDLEVVSARLVKRR